MRWSLWLLALFGVAVAVALGLSLQVGTVTVFVAREYQDGDIPDDLKEGDELKVRVLGQRFELHDDSVCVIASLITESN